MMLMAEWHGLWPRHLGVGDIRGTLKLNTRPEDERNQKHRAIQCGAGDGISAAMKDLHLSELSAVIVLVDFLVDSHV